MSWRVLLSHEDPHRNLAANAALARNHWAFLIRGVVAILFGILAIILPGTALFSLVFAFAAYLVIDGIFAIVAAVRAMEGHERWGLFIAEGLLDFLLAAGIFLVPLGAILSFVWITAFWAVITGALMIGAALRLHRHWWLLVGGLVSVLWGAAMAVMPFFGALLLTWWIAAYAIVFGVSLVIAATHLRAGTTLA